METQIKESDSLIAELFTLNAERRQVVLVHCLRKSPHIPLQVTSSMTPEAFPTKADRPAEFDPDVSASKPLGPTTRIEGSVRGLPQISRRKALAFLMGGLMTWTRLKLLPREAVR